MADGAGEDEEVEDGVHEGTVVERVEQGSSDVADALGDNPGEGGGDGVDEGLQGHEARKSHEDEAGSLQVAVLLEPRKAHHRAHDGARPDEGEEGPAPPSLLAQGNERDGGIGTGNVPVDGGMVELAQHFLELPLRGQGVIDGGGNVGGEHAEKVEPDGELRPAVALAIDPIEEHRTHDKAEQYARSMGRGVQYLFFLAVMYGHGIINEELRIVLN